MTMQTNPEHTLKKVGIDVEKRVGTIVRVYHLRRIKRSDPPSFAKASLFTGYNAESAAPRREPLLSATLAGEKRRIKADSADRDWNFLKPPRNQALSQEYPKRETRDGERGEKENLVFLSTPPNRSRHRIIPLPLSLDGERPTRLGYCYARILLRAAQFA